MQDLNKYPPTSTIS